MTINETPVRIKSDPERALIAAAWANPGPFACDADRLALHLDDFSDRLIGVVAGYLRDCGESGRVPTLADAEAVLDEFAVPRDADELFFLLGDHLRAEYAIPIHFADLIRDVQRAAADRADELCRALTRAAWRAMVRGLRCPHCRAGRTDPNERRFASPRARKQWTSSRRRPVLV